MRAPYPSPPELRAVRDAADAAHRGAYRRPLSTPLVILLASGIAIDRGRAALQLAADPKVPAGHAATLREAALVTRRRLSHGLVRGGYGNLLNESPDPVQGIRELARRCSPVLPAAVSPCGVRRWQTPRCPICGAKEDGTEETASHSPEATVHRRDSDCTVGSDGCCVRCGVSHSGTCPSCGARAYHRAGCPGSDEGGT